MLNKLYRYPLSLTGEVELPRLSRVVSFGYRSGTLCIWAIVDVEKVTTEKHRYIVLPTGAVVPVGAKHLFTTHLEKEQETYHLFEL
jgi:hypothetical protein